MQVVAGGLAALESVAQVGFGRDLVEDMVGVGNPREGELNSAESDPFSDDLISPADAGEKLVSMLGRYVGHAGCDWCSSPKMAHVGRALPAENTDSGGQCPPYI